MSLNENTILQLHPNVLKRFEQNCQNGTLFLFNIESEDFWTGNYATHQILKIVNGKNKLKDIYMFAEKIYNEFDVNTVINSINTVFDELLNKGFLIEVQTRK